MAFIRDIMVGIRRLIDIQDRPHNDLTNRDATDCHPPSSITGLSTDLAGKVDKSGSITQLSDVTILSPTTDQILKYNGIKWTNSGQIVVGAGPGIIFYLDSTEIIPPGPGPQTFPIETLSKTPTSGAEVSESVTVNNSTGLIDQYLYNTALGISSISAGEWIFNTYCSVDDASGVSEIIISVGKVFTGAGTIAITGSGTSRTATVTGGTPFLASDFNADITQTSYIITPTAVLRIIGFTSTSVVTVETLVTYTNETGVAYSVDRYLFQATTGEINNLTVALVEHTQVQPAFAINTTDKLTVRYYGKTTNVGNIIITIYHNGTEHYTRINTPLPTLHNDLAGLQGGAGNEFYHLTSAEHADVLQSLNKKNILEDAEITFQNWTQTPGTIANILDEKNNALTTLGIAGVGSGANVTFDLGVSKRFVISVMAFTDSIRIEETVETSDDGINFTYVCFLGEKIYISGSSGTAICKTRYVRFRSYPTIDTAEYSILGIRAYLL